MSGPYYRVEVSQTMADSYHLTWGVIPGSGTYGSQDAAEAFAEGYAVGFWPKNPMRRAAFRSHCRIVQVI